MAEFVEVMSQRKRMHDVFFAKDCINCPIGFDCNGKKISCTDLSLSFPKEAEEIIMKWAKEHIQTNADKFKEVFGFEPIMVHCPKQCERAGCDGCNFSGWKWWKKEYKEPTKD